MGISNWQQEVLTRSAPRKPGALFFGRLFWFCGSGFGCNFTTHDAQTLRRKLNHVTRDDLLALARLDFAVHRDQTLLDHGFRLAAILDEAFELQDLVELHRLACDDDIAHYFSTSSFT